MNSNDFAYLDIIDALHENWKPHSGQLDVGKAIFNDQNIKTVFLQCGRKWGKSEFIIYCLWRHALMNPGSSCYYFSPFMKQSREIVWSERRLQNFGPRKYIAKIDNNDLRITFTNGSFIKVDGSDNYEAYRGIQPSCAVYDEFKDFHPQFHEGMAPNLAVKRAPLLLIGTPPRVDDRNYIQYIQLSDECKQRSDSLWVCKPTHENPIISKEWLESEKKKHFDRGEPDIWYREYEARLVAGGKRSIFPMLDRNKHVEKHAKIVHEIRNDIKNLEWYVVLDPGTTTCFAALYVALNPYSKKIYVMDCIYETSQAQTSIRNIYPRILETTQELYPQSDIMDDWFRGIDEAAAWANNEFLNEFGTYFTPTSKSKHKKEDGISLMKDIMLNDGLIISDKCEPLLFEMENYVTDDFGKFPKKNDHLIDCFRYFLGQANYNSNEAFAAKRKVYQTEMVKAKNDTDFFDRKDWTQQYEEND